MVDIESIQVKGLCGLSVDEIKKEALKYIMATLPKIANIDIYSSFQLHVKIPKCMTSNESNFFMLTLNNFLPCQPDDCCLAQYEIVTEWDRVHVIGQTNYINNYVSCLVTGGDNCQYSCESLDFTPQEILNIQYSGVNDPCLAECFWKLEGNNISDENFLGTLNDKPIVFKTNNTEKMRILPNGNVGIGTLFPNSNFEVQTKSLLNGNKISFGEFNGNPSIRLYRRTGTEPLCPDVNHENAYPWWIEINDDYLTTEVYGGLFFKSRDGDAVCSDGNEIVDTKVAFLRNGNVGIGVINPQEKLEVDGKIKATQINVTEHLIIDQGRVGIGVQDPQEKLEVDGNIIASAIKTTGNILSEGTICAKEVNIVDVGCQWPDYVFKNDYKLLSLEALEKAISVKGSLPGVPTADEIKANGVELGKMQAILLQKIEELTLYILQLNKNNQELQMRNQEMEKLIQSLKEIKSN